MKKYLLFFAFLSFFVNESFAQNGKTCDSAISIFTKPTCDPMDFLMSAGDTARWFVFTADSQMVHIEWTNPVFPADTPFTHIHTLALYSGPCSALQLLALRDIDNGDSSYSMSAVLIIDHNGLTIGQNYYIRVTGKTPIHCSKGLCKNVNSYFGLCVQDLTIPSNPNVAAACSTNCSFCLKDLICNGAFECTDGYPTGPTQIRPFNNVLPPDRPKPWYNPCAYMTNVDPSPDYFNTFATSPLVTVPANMAGNQTSLIGPDGYAGITTYTTIIPDWREYIEEALIAPTVPNKVYWTSFNVSLGDNCAFRTTNIGAYFSAGNVAELGVNLSTLTPQVEYTGTQIASTTNWTPIRGCFSSTVALDHITIGSFRTDAYFNGTFAQFVPTGVNCSCPYKDIAYYYIDSVSVVPLADAGLDMCANNQIGPLCKVPGATYSWVPTTGLSCTTCANPVATPTVNTIYTVYVTTAGYNNTTCTDNDQVLVIALPISAISGPASSCDPNSIYTVPSVVGNTYTWSVPSTITFTGQYTNTITVTNWNQTSTFASSCFTSIGVTVVNPQSCTSSSSIQVSKCCTSDPTITTTGCPSNSNLSCSSPGSPNFYNALASTLCSGIYNSPGVITGRSFTINGTFTVDIPSLSLINCTISMGPRAKIIVGQGKTLSIGVGGGPCYIHSCCDFMWDGIYVDGTNPASKLNITSQSIIEDAQNAVVSTNGGNYFIDHSTLNKNYINVLVQPYSNFHPGIIEQTTIECTPIAGPCTKPGPNLRQPHAGNITFEGVEINSVKGINVGNPALPILLNVFDKMTYGVRAKTSIVRVVNNSFKNMIPSLLPPFAGSGVFEDGGFSISLAPQLVVGGTMPNESNSFTKCFRGVTAINNVRTRVVLNTFNNFNLSGVLVQNCLNTQINVLNNSFTNPTSQIFAIAIGAVDVAGSTVNIVLNNILQATTVPNPNNIGIIVANVNQNPVDLNIDNNQIIRVQTGISVVNIAGPSAKVQNNGVFFNQLAANPPLTTHYGIRVMGCNGIVIGNQNTISKPGTNPPIAYVPLLRGISVENSPQTIVAKNNSMTKTGSGIFCDGLDNNSTLACNQFISTWNGIFFNSATVGNQLDPNIAQANQWFTPANPAARMSGTITPPINFWWMGGPAFSPIPHTLTSGSFNLGHPMVTTNTFDICTTFFLAPQVAERQMKFGAIAENQQIFIDNQTERSYWSKQYAFRTFRNNPGMLNLNAADDTTYQHFYSAIIPSCMNSAENVKHFMDQQDVSNSIIANNQMSPSNQMEVNRKIVNDIYINSWLNGTLSFSSSDSATLFSIANENPVLSGDAVYSARVLLKYFPDDQLPNGNGRMMETQEPNIVSGKIYPNPANDEAYLDYPLNDGETGTFEIFSIVGDKVANYVLKPNALFRFSTLQMNAGIYICKVQVNGQLVYTEKFVVIK